MVSKLSTCVVRLLVAANRFVNEEEGTNLLSTSDCLKLIDFSLSDVLDGDEMSELHRLIVKNQDLLGK
jgi:hypothetical protein